MDASVARIATGMTHALQKTRSIDLSSGNLVIRQMEYSPQSDLWVRAIAVSYSGHLSPPMPEDLPVREGGCTSAEKCYEVCQMPKRKSTSGSKHAHHELPVLYLRGFCDPNTSYLWVYRPERPFHPGAHRKNDNPFRSSLRITAQKKDRYAFVTPDGDRDFETFENLLQKAETRTEVVLSRIRAQ
ncbi:MAG: DUF4238 domain-containing protein [Candidatus Marsarchaeota archaeon]|nr:DUF4238 domain-containing protein [Candidatus Marsarchaeota archaeon]